MPPRLGGRGRNGELCRHGRARDERTGRRAALRSGPARADGPRQHAGADPRGLRAVRPARSGRARRADPGGVREPRLQVPARARGDRAGHRHADRGRARDRRRRQERVSLPADCERHAAPGARRPRRGGGAREHPRPARHLRRARLGRPRCASSSGAPPRSGSSSPTRMRRDGRRSTTASSSSPACVRELRRDGLRAARRLAGRPRNRDRADRGGAPRSADRDAVLGIRQLGHALRRLRPAGRAAHDPREARGRRRGSPPDGHRALGRAPHPLGPRRRLRRSCATRLPRSACSSARSTRTSSRSRTTGSAACATPIPTVRRRAIDHILECIEIAGLAGSDSISLWLADGTNYPGQDSLAARRERLVESLQEAYAALPEAIELLVEYKLYEPAFYSTDLADWGAALTLCQELGPARPRPRRPRTSRPGREHRADRLAAPAARPARRVPLQRPQVRRRRPDRRLDRPVPALPDLRRARRHRGVRDGSAPDDRPVAQRSSRRSRR